jgi:hypothetical protein
MSRQSRHFTWQFPLGTLVTWACLLVAARPALSYEQATHALITREAYVHSKLELSNSDLMLRIGLDERQVTSLSDSYIDIAPNGVRVRVASPSDLPDFSSQKIRDVNKRYPTFSPQINSVAGWLMLGAIREDDVPFDQWSLENNPQDDPNGPLSRVFNHFYDPLNDRALTVAGRPYGARAVDWATQTTIFEIVDDPVAGSHVLRDNHFGIPFAREAMWRALTLKRTDVSGALVDLVAPPDVPTAAALWALRQEYWATTFRALGDALHLLQDMAQPQHTRNDRHAGMGCVMGRCLAGHASYYEKYVDAQATGAPRFRLRERFRNAPTDPDAIETLLVSNLVLDGYPNVQFTHYTDFFATVVGPNSINGAGLANYSNQGFFTAGTNLDSAGAGYDSPPWTAGSLIDQTIPDGSVTNAAGRPVAGALKLKLGPVQDHLNPAESTALVKLSSVGAFDQFLHQSGRNQYSLNHYNYDDQASLLIPRAVAYSAGLLNYFFRGVLDIGLPSGGAYAVIDHTQQGCRTVCGFRAVQLKLKNLTPNETLSKGFFVAVAKFFRNNSYASDLSGEPGAPGFTGFGARSSWEEIVVSEKLDIATLPGGSLGPNSAAEIQFNFASPIPINATDIYLQVVFRGQLGNETDAVVVATKNISEPNYVAVVNDLDYRYDPSTDTFQTTDPKTTPQTVTNLGVKLNGASTPIATLAQLNARGYAQLAFLTDLGTDGTERLAIDFNAGGMNGPLSFSNFPLATFASSGPGNYERSKSVVRYRGMWSDYRLDLFSISTPFNLYNCVTGDARRICTSAGLTTIPVSNAVAWSINFP